MKVGVTVWTSERQWYIVSVEFGFGQRKVWYLLTYIVNMYTRKSKGPRKCSPRPLGDRAHRTLPQHSLKNVTNLFTSETGMPVDYAMPKAEHNRPSNSRAQRPNLFTRQICKAKCGVIMRGQRPSVERYVART